jgi:hypothetical protein
MPGGPELLIDRRASTPRTPNCPADSQTTPEGTPVRLPPSQSAQGEPHPSTTTTSPPRGIEQPTSKLQTEDRPGHNSPVTQPKTNQPPPMPGQFNLRKLRGHDLVTKPERHRRYHVPPQAARTITALLTLREHVIAPIVAGVRVPRRGRPPTHWTPVDRDYEALRVNMTKLFEHLAITTDAA